MTKQATRAYMLEFGGAMLAYTVVVIASGFFLRRYPESALRIPIALSPVIPSLLALWAFIRALGRMDELQRRIQFDAIAFGASATAMITFTYGFLENVGFPHLSVIFVLPLMTTLWGIGSVFSTWRYR